MASNNFINLKQQRDFGEVFGTGIKFIKQNFKGLFMAELLIAGPFILLLAISTAIQQSDAMNAVFNDANPLGEGSQFDQFNTLYFANIALQIVTNLVLLGVVIEYMKLYGTHGKGGFGTNDVGKALVKDLGKMIGAFLMMLVFVVVIGGGVAVIIGGLGMGAGNTGLAVILGIIAFLAALIVGPPLSFWGTAVYFFAINERKGAMDSIAGAWRMMKKSFWWSWLIVVVAFLGVVIVSMVFVVPAVIIGVFSGINGADDGSATLQTIILIVTAVATVLSLLLYAVAYVIIGLHYYSEKEKTDGTGLLERIEGLGSGQTYRDVEESY